MRRDMDLVREMLLAVEAHDGTVDTFEWKLPKYTPAVIDIHLAWLLEAGFIEGMLNRKKGGSAPTRLTWEGCNFLDSARDPGIWKKALDGVRKSVGSVPVALLQTLLMKLAEQTLKQQGILP